MAKGPSRPATAANGAAAAPVAPVVAGNAYRSVLIAGVPHIKQEPDFCGEACAAAYLRKLGFAYDQDAVFNAARLDPALARGCYTRDLGAALSRIGFRVGPVWYSLAADAPQQIEAQWRALHADLLAGVPSIICTHYDRRPGSSEHFRLILGYDAARDEVIYHEPAAADGAYRRMARAAVLEMWPLKYDRRTWKLVRMRMEPGQIAAPSRPASPTDAELAQHLMKLKENMPEGDFHVVIQRPFVVIGDEDESVVRGRRARDTVKWAVDMLKQDYFTKNPRDIIDVWLFKDKESYETNAEALFGEAPTTPYGYYSPTDKALIMNISTGGGTLVHEIVHPFMATNFPECPSWYNEGLASLYEQSGTRDGHIIGRTNWRLPGLQRAIRAKGIPTFATLCATTTREFYDDPHGTNYGQARYLCYYLQEKGKLRDFYHRFRKGAATDPSGYETLKAVLGEKDMEAFQKRWEKYVLALEYD
ncbi:MAG: hypothetical protein K8T25_18475 [Planctomycetia bacterium]|nr:hypothetical protein [Planctomycetia bacterium]